MHPITAVPQHFLLWIKNDNGFLGRPLMFVSPGKQQGKLVPGLIVELNVFTHWTPNKGLPLLFMLHRIHRACPLTIMEIWWLPKGYLWKAFILREVWAYILKLCNASQPHWGVRRALRLKIIYVLSLTSYAFFYITCRISTFSQSPFVAWIILCCTKINCASQKIWLCRHFWNIGIFMKFHLNCNECAVSL